MLEYAEIDALFGLLSPVMSFLRASRIDTLLSLPCFELPSVHLCCLDASLAC